MKVVITITGPSGSGKSTLEKKLVEPCGIEPAGFGRVISTTTRSPRANEKDGVDYFFVSKEQFAELEKAGKFVESISLGEHRYGASVAEFDRCFSMNQPVVIVVEPVGRDMVKEYGAKHGWKVLSVFLDNPPEILATRLISRFTDEVKANAGSPNAKPYNDFAKRLGQVIGLEAFWRIEAAQNDKLRKYDMIFSEFGVRNGDLVTNFLRGVAFAYQTGGSATHLMVQYLKMAYEFDKKQSVAKATEIVVPPLPVLDQQILGTT